MILKEIISNQIFLSALFSNLLAQAIKTAYDWHKHKKFIWQSMFRGAGMPSSHTSTVIALALSTFLVEGPTNLFIITLVFAAIVVRDVIGDKVFATHQQNIINSLVQQLIRHEKVTWNHLIGHTITEVLVGALLAVVVTLTIFFYF